MAPRTEATGHDWAGYMRKDRASKEAMKGAGSTEKGHKVSRTSKCSCTSRRARTTEIFSIKRRECAAGNFRNFIPSGAKHGTAEIVKAGGRQQQERESDSSRSIEGCIPSTSEPWLTWRCREPSSESSSNFEPEGKI